MARPLDSQEKASLTVTLMIDSFILAVLVISAVTTASTALAAFAWVAIIIVGLGIIVTPLTVTKIRD